MELEALVRLADDPSDDQVLWQRIAELEAQLSVLTRDLEEARRAARRQAAPFRRPKGKKHRKRPGRKKGHPGSYRMPPDQVDETRDQPLSACPHCQGPLKKLRDYLNYVIEWPEVRAKIIEYVTHGGYCTHCRKHVRSRHPEQPSTASGAASVTLGPRALAIAASFHVRHGVSFQRAAELFATLCGLPITAGGIAQALQRLGRRLDATYRALIEALQVSDAVFADETGWRILRATTWLWVFCNRDITIYVVDARKNHEVPLSVLGEGFVGILHHDGARTYDTLPYTFHQTCLEHLLRDLDELVEVKKAGAVRWPRAVAQLLRDALALRREHGVQIPEGDDDPSGQIEARLDRLLVADLTDPDNARMQKRLERNRQMLFTFLYQQAAEGTNSRAERQLRPMLIGRKIGAGNRSWRGALAHQIVASIVATARQQGHNEVDILAEAARNPAGAAITTLLPPDPPTQDEPRAETVAPPPMTGNSPGPSQPAASPPVQAQPEPALVAPGPSLAPEPSPSGTEAPGATVPTQSDGATCRKPRAATASRPRPKRLQAVAAAVPLLLLWALLRPVAPHVIRPDASGVGEQSDLAPTMASHEAPSGVVPTHRPCEVVRQASLEPRMPTVTTAPMQGPRPVLLSHRGHPP